MMQYLKFPDESSAQKLTGWWSNNTGWPHPRSELQIAVRGTSH